MTLILAPGVLDEMVEHARACLPAEACGFLVGHGEHGDRIVPAPNALESPAAFFVEPRFLFRFFRDLRESGENLVAIYHSHPSGEPVPSEKDIASAYYPDCAHLIVGMREPVPRVRAYRIAGGRATEIELRAIV